MTPTTSPEDLLSSYHKLNELYSKAEACQLPREMEYLTGLILDLLRHESLPLLTLHEMERNENRNGKNSSVGGEQICPKTVNATPDPQTIRHGMMSHWIWLQIRSVFIQGRLDEALRLIEGICSDEFSKWTKTKREMAQNELPTSEDSVKESVLLRCGFLKCVSLEKSRKFGELMKFSSMFVSHLSQIRTISPLRVRMLAKVLAVQGRVLASENVVDSAIQKFRAAAITSLMDVPWVLRFLIGTYRLSAIEETKLLRELIVLPTPAKVGRREPNTADIVAPLLLSLNDCTPACQSFTEMLQIKGSLEAVELTVVRCLERGEFNDAEMICRSGLQSYPLRWRLIRVMIECLFVSGDAKKHEELRAMENSLMKEWPERPETWLASGLVKLVDRELNDAINKFNHGYYQLPTPSHTIGTSATSDAHLYLLLYHCNLSIYLDRLNESAETLDEIKLQFPHCPFLLLLQKRFEFATLLGSPSGGNELPTLQTSTECPWTAEVLGDIALAKQDMSISHGYYLRSYFLFDQMIQRMKLKPPSTSTSPQSASQSSLSIDSTPFDSTTTCDEFSAFCVDRFNHRFTGSETFAVQSPLFRVLAKVTMLLVSMEMVEESEKFFAEIATFDDVSLLADSLLNNEELSPLERVFGVAPTNHKSVTMTFWAESALDLASTLRDKFLPS